ncbi:MAG: ArnT family glycosyltransferase [Steroidobacteraceae bacterium]
MFGKLLHGVASLFERAAPNGRLSRVHVALLVAIVAIGGALRAWELGAVGLHGDEETMAMPTMHIVEHGSPILPSGMFYPRALAQLYLMAGSVLLFGESEWAFRLPSALCGTFLIVLAYFVGRRFLAPAWNLVFAATVAFLPALIVDSQSARMYIFLTASIAAMLVLVFRWERTGRLGALAGAFVALLVGLQFHSLAVFSALLFLFPGLLHDDRRRLLEGSVACGVSLAALWVIEYWTATYYPAGPSIQGLELRFGPKARWAVPGVSPLLLLGGGAAALIMARAVARRVTLTSAAWAAAALVAAGLVAQLFVFYHVAALLLIAGGVVAIRHGERVTSPLLMVAAVSLAIAVAHVVLLRSNGVESFRQLFGAMVGRPSVWPFIALSQYSLVAAAAAIAGVAASLILLARRQRVPDFMLLFVLGVWAPLLVIGVLKWYVPLRYTEGQVLPLLLVGCATAQWLVVRWEPVRRHALTAVFAGLLFVNPLALARTVGAEYAIHPDHKGAAAFIRSQHLAPEDIVLAEDVLQQTYYLGNVDYWLVARYVAARFTRDVDGELRDIYTNVPALTTAEELEALIARTDRGAIYVIGSGENQEDGRRHMRGPEIFEALQSPRFEVVYEGRDGLTKVWKIARRQSFDNSSIEARAATHASAAQP